MDENDSRPLPPFSVQPSLLPTSDLKKPHAMVVMVPRSGKITLTTRRLYNAQLNMAQAVLEDMREMPPADFMFSAPLKSLLRLTGTSGEERTAAQRYLREMRTAVVDWESTAQGDGIKWSNFNMLSEVRLSQLHGQTWVHWAYPPTIMEALRDPGRWVTLDLQRMSLLSSYPAHALYEILARYKNNPSGLTSRQSPEWWTKAISMTPIKGEPRDWRRTKHEKINPSLEEICRNMDLEAELIEHKVGRVVAEVQFAIRQKKAPRPASTKEPVDLDLVRLATALGIQEAKLDVLVELHGDEIVRRALRMTDARVQNKALSPLQSAYAYMRTVISNGDANTSPTGPAPQAHPVGIDSTDASSDPPRPPSPSVAASQALIAQQKVQKQLDDDQAQLLVARKEAISKLPRPELDALVETAIKVAQERKQYSVLVKRRVEQGDYLHALFGAIMVECYVKAYPDRE